jgi:hypothetical protein
MDKLRKIKTMADSQQSQKSESLDSDIHKVVNEKGTTRTLKIDKSSPQLESNNRDAETKMRDGSRLSQENGDGISTLTPHTQINIQIHSDTDNHGNSTSKIKPAEEDRPDPKEVAERLRVF